MRAVSEKELSHDRMAEDQVPHISSYDTTRRVTVLIDEFLRNIDLVDKKVLDVGCGLGYFSQRLVQMGAQVTACDLGENLVNLTTNRTGCRGLVADALSLTDTFTEGEFDLVVSSECIEHTPNPMAAITEMTKVLKPGGFLSLSTPNILWQPVVRSASALNLRAFSGYENFSSWNSISKAMKQNGMTIIEKRGLHLWPFQLGLHRLSTWSDRYLQGLRFLMINICVLGQKSVEES
jgi:2-polyprenyl-3-methyl-5-hydroxy-6-metoxy-1,4-benzoquinol methylase